MFYHRRQQWNKESIPSYKVCTEKLWEQARHWYTWASYKILERRVACTQGKNHHWNLEREKCRKWNDMAVDQRHNADTGPVKKAAACTSQNYRRVSKRSVC